MRAGTETVRVSTRAARIEDRNAVLGPALEDPTRPRLVDEMRAPAMTARPNNLTMVQLHCSARSATLIRTCIYVSSPPHRKRHEVRTSSTAYRTRLGRAPIPKTIQLVRRPRSR